MKQSEIHVGQIFEVDFERPSETIDLILSLYPTNGIWRTLTLHAHPGPERHFPIGCESSGVYDAYLNNDEFCRRII